MLQHSPLHHHFNFPPALPPYPPPLPMLSSLVLYSTWSFSNAFFSCLLLHVPSYSITLSFLFSCSTSSFSTELSLSFVSSFTNTYSFFFSYFTSLFSRAFSFSSSYSSFSFTTFLVLPVCSFIPFPCFPMPFLSPPRPPPSFLYVFFLMFHFPFL